MNLTEKEAIYYAWHERHGFVPQDILPPITPVFKEAFKKGVKYAKGEPIEEWDKESE